MWTKVLARLKPSVKSSKIQSSHTVFGLSSFSLDLDEEEEQGFLAGLQIPAPWTSGKTIESVHPLRDNYRYKNTVHIPGARYLYLRFDPRCASQYDYDKVRRGLLEVGVGETNYEALVTCHKSDVQEIYWCLLFVRCFSWFFTLVPIPPPKRWLSTVETHLVMAAEAYWVKDGRRILSRSV